MSSYDGNYARFVEFTDGPQNQGNNANNNAISVYIRSSGQLVFATRVGNNEGGVASNSGFLTQNAWTQCVFSRFPSALLPVVSPLTRPEPTNPPANRPRTSASSHTAAAW